MSSLCPSSFNLVKYFMAKAADSRWKHEGNRRFGLNIIKIPKLEEIFLALENPYCSWGTFDKDLSKHVLYIDHDSCATLRLPFIEKIISLSLPAPFSKDGETIVDEYVKNVSEVSGDRISIKDSLFKQGEIIPLPYPIQMTGKEVPCKILVCEESDSKFEMQHETPPGKIHLGTLLVCIPTEFEGGELVVRSDFGEETRLGCGYDEEGHVQAWWSFLLAGCNHAFEPVTSGTSIFLQYDFFTDQSIEFGCVRLIDREFLTTKEGEIIKFEEEKEIIPKVFKSDNLSLDSSVKSQVKIAKLTPNQSENFLDIMKYFIELKINLGIILSHMYPAHGKMEANLLRGRDRLLYDCIMELKDSLPEMNIVLKYLINEQQRSDSRHLLFSDSYIIEPCMIEAVAGKRSYTESTADLVDEESQKKNLLSRYNGLNLFVAQHPGGYFKDIIKTSGSQYSGVMPDKAVYVSTVLIIEFFKPSKTCSIKK